MATSIGNLAVLLSANAAQMDKGLNQAAKKLQGFFGVIEGFGAGGIGGGLSGAFALLPGPMGAAAGAATGLIQKFIDLRNESFKQIDALDAMATRLGITTEALAGLQFAAQLADVETGSMERGFSKFLQTLGQAELGSKTAIKTFDDIKISWQGLARMSPEKAFAALFESIAKLPNQAQKIAALRDVFGKTGDELAGLLEKSGSRIADALELTRKVGTAVPKEMAQSVSDADDAWKKLGETIKGTFHKLQGPQASKGFADTFSRIFSGEFFEDIGTVLKENTGWQNFTPEATIQHPAFDAEAQSKAAAAASAELQSRADALTKKINEQTEAFGKSAEAIERSKIAQDGANDTMLKGVDAAIKQLEAKKAAKEASEQAEKQALENFKRELDRSKKKRDAVEQSFHRAMQSDKALAAPEAAGFGSREALSKINQLERERTHADKQKDPAEILKRMEMDQKRQLEEQRLLRQLIKRGGLIQAVEI